MLDAASFFIGWGIGYYGTGWYYPPYYYGGGYYPYYPSYGHGSWYNPNTGGFGSRSVWYGPYGGYTYNQGYDPKTAYYADLDAAVTAIAATPLPDMLLIGRLKRKKLQLKDEIARAIGDRPVVIKPNNVVIDRDLAVTPAPALEGILEFLRYIGKAKGVIIAESAANGPTPEGFSNYGYEPLARKYGARLVDLDRSPTTTIFAVDQTDMRPKPIRAARLLMDRSAARSRSRRSGAVTFGWEQPGSGKPICLR